eukprot:5705248-Amphidinium_carterae.1
MFQVLCGSISKSPLTVVLRVVVALGICDGNVLWLHELAVYIIAHRTIHSPPSRCYKMLLSMLER